MRRHITNQISIQKFFVNEINGNFKNTIKFYRIYCFISNSYQIDD
jgi:hypothetical protein